MLLPNFLKRKPRVLTQLAVSEISAVDKAAAPGAHIVLRKRDADRAALQTATARLAASVGSIIGDNSVIDKRQMLARTFGQYLAHVNPRVSLAEIAKLHAIFKNDNERSEPDLSNTDAGMPNRRRRRAGDDDETETERLSREADEKDQDMTTKSHTLNDIVKRYGFVALAKSVNAGAVTLTEEAYTKALVADCARRGVSFEKAFCDTSPEGVEIRKGRERCRDTAFAKAGQGQLMPLMPTQVGGDGAQDVNAGKEGDAYKQLMAMAQKMKDASPELTLEQAFARTYTSAGARALAEQERRDSRSRLPTTGGRTAGGWGS